MCSISGIAVKHRPASQNPEECRDAMLKIIGGMNQMQSRRGPDGTGEYFALSGNSAVALGHTRLAVMDIANGHEPMLNEDASLALSFNGEIYNFRELKASLHRKHLFKSASDAEVVLHLFEEQGCEAFARLSGMFAFALYNKNTGELYCVRDRWGKKPLYYFETGSGDLVFASLISALKKHPQFPGDEDAEAMHHFCAFQSFPVNASAFSAVKKIPPRHYIKWSGTAGTEITEFISDRFSPSPGQSGNTPSGRKNAAAKLRELFFAAVEKRLDADVPMGAFLSGGTDSAILCAVLNEFPKGRSLPLFCAGTDDPKYDESALALSTAKFLHRQNDLAVLKITAPEFSFFRELIQHAGEPLGDASILPSALLCREAKKHVSVVLGGDGADELFGGYERYLVMDFSANAGKFIPGFLFSLAAKLLPGGSDFRSAAFRLKRLAEVLALPRDKRYAAMLCKEPQRQYLPETGVADAKSAMLYDIHSYLPCDILPKLDLASLFSALEMRSPFLDDTLAEFAVTLPSHWNISPSGRKLLLKEAFGKMLPAELWKRRKRGFSLPLGGLLRRAWRDEADKYLSADKFAAPYWGEHLSGRNDYSGYLFCRLACAVVSESAANGTLDLQ